LKERYRYIRQGYVVIAIVLMLWFYCPIFQLTGEFQLFYPFRPYSNCPDKGPRFRFAYPNYPILASCVLRDIATRESNSYRRKMRLRRFRNSNRKLDGKHHNENHRDHEGKNAEAGPLPREPSFHLPDSEIDLRSWLDLPTVRQTDWES